MSSRINIRIDEDLKNTVQKILEEMGMDMSTAVTILFKEINRTHEFPFKPCAKPGIEEAMDDINHNQINNYDSVKVWKDTMNKL